MNEGTNEIKDISDSQPGIGVKSELPFPHSPVLSPHHHLTLEILIYDLLKCHDSPTPIPTTSFENHCKEVMVFSGVWVRDSVENHL